MHLAQISQNKVQCICISGHCSFTPTASVSSTFGAVYCSPVSELNDERQLQCVSPFGRIKTFVDSDVV
ncbi:hypothetical protein DPMN_030518 [Dreissena polymorpha]|uniref:Uncharacterized protein n=1 Tax=Dreissena polymorpha TaxID=45954 RepID=A0A9D4RI62_DREPO|nr:hypothetical protein DPMN_030518 [Dreissena polymorpha]